MGKIIVRTISLYDNQVTIFRPVVKEFIALEMTCKTKVHNLSARYNRDLKTLKLIFSRQDTKLLIE